MKIKIVSNYAECGLYDLSKMGDETVGALVRGLLAQTLLGTYKDLQLKITDDDGNTLGKDADTSSDVPF